jgi:hypothetical protein
MTLPVFKLKSTVSYHRVLCKLTLGTLLLSMAACASTPMPPTQQLQAADLAITNAEQAGVADYASQDLTEAREKLSAANVAVQARKMLLARQLADESRVSAELATAKASAGKAKVVNDEMLKSINTLKQEMLRNTGNQQ